MKTFELTLRLRNNRLKERRLAAGMNQRLLAMAAGIRYPDYNELECLRRSPLTKKGEWREIARRLANFWDCPVEELFPEAVCRDDINELSVKLDEQDLLGIPSYREPLALPDPEETYIAEESVARLVAAIDQYLSPREAECIRRRYGLGEYHEHTYAEIGEAIGRSVQRSLQIVAKAERKLRHPRSGLRTLIREE